MLKDVILGSIRVAFPPEKRAVDKVMVFDASKSFGETQLLI